MVDSVVTKQELINAQKDAQSLEDVINGPADTRVKPRIGPEMWTLATINSLVQQGQIKISDLSEAIQIALAAGAGSAGWTANLVADGNQTQKEINLYGGKKYDMPVGGYPTGAVVRLENGDIVKSTTPNNTKNPNVDMTGWVKTNDASQIFDGLMSQKQINGIAIFNKVNVLNFIPSSQHYFIKIGSVAGQDKSLVTQGIKDAIVYAKTLTRPNFYIPSGIFAVNDTIEIDLASGSTICFDGAIASSANNKELLIIGSKTTNRFNYNLKDIVAYHIDPFTQIANDTLKKSVAVLLLNIVSATGNIRTASGCWRGVVVDATMPNGGSSYNEIHLGSLKDNVICAHLTAQEPNGYTNENTFYGGSFGHSGAFPYTGEEVDIIIDEGAATQKLNNNLFFRPSLESNNALSKAARISGAYNSIYMPRVENSQNYEGFSIEFTAQSSNCSVLGGGFGLKNSNIVDNGFQSKYENSDGMYFCGSTSALSNRGVLELKNAASNLGKNILSRNTANAETFTVLASGKVISEQEGYFLKGIRWQTSDGTLNDRGVFLSTTVPNGNVVGRAGSIHFDTTTGKASVKRAGTGNTGWIGLQEIYPSTTATRPTDALLGQMFFDTTLGKPIWWKGATWVDATGVTV